MILFEGDGYKDPMNVLVPERQSHPGIQSYIQSLTDLYDFYPWNNYLNEMSYMVDAINSPLEADEDNPVRDIFFSGAIIGLHVVRACTPRNIRKRMLFVSIGRDTENPDGSQRMHDYNDSLIDNGHRGCEAVPEITDLIESWETEVTPNMRLQPLVRRGFGLMMYVLSEINEQVAKENMQTSFRNMEQVSREGINWDAEFGKIIFPRQDEF